MLIKIRLHEGQSLPTLKLYHTYEKQFTELFVQFAYTGTAKWIKIHRDYRTPGTYVEKAPRIARDWPSSATRRLGTRTVVVVVAKKEKKSKKKGKMKKKKFFPWSFLIWKRRFSSSPRRADNFVLAPLQNRGVSWWSVCVGPGVLWFLSASWNDGSFRREGVISTVNIFAIPMSCRPTPEHAGRGCFSVSGRKVCVGRGGGENRCCYRNTS